MLADPRSIHHRVGELSIISIVSRLDSMVTFPYCPTIDERVPTALL